MIIKKPIRPFVTVYNCGNSNPFLRRIRISIETRHILSNGNQ